MASSFIEGATAPGVDIVLAEAHESRSPFSESWVEANLAAVTEAIEWRERLGLPRAESRRVRSDAAAWRVLDLLSRHLVLTGPIVSRDFEFGRDLMSYANPGAPIVLGPRWRSDGRVLVVGVS